jgi:hypothetical protein
MLPRSDKGLYSLVTCNNKVTGKRCSLRGLEKGRAVGQSAFYEFRVEAIQRGRAAICEKSMKLVWDGRQPGVKRSELVGERVSYRSAAVPSLWLVTVSSYSGDTVTVRTPRVKETSTVRSRYQATTLKTWLWKLVCVCTIVNFGVWINDRAIVTRSYDL